MSGRRRVKAALLAGCVLALAMLARAARADDPALATGATTVDVTNAGDARAYQLDRTWLYVDDASIAAPMRAVAGSSATYTSTGGSPTRPFASNIGAPGAMLQMGGEVGLESSRNGSRFWVRLPSG